MTRSKKPLWWTQLSDKELLELRFCDLNLSLRKSRLTPFIKKLYKELSEKDLRFKPHFWVADEWFATDGIPGIALPFYLTHDRLIDLHIRQLGDAEGSDPIECMKLLRHEAGHALDNAFHLRRLRKRQKLFGLSSTPYPDHYYPKLGYKNFVYHLNPWYTQAHPDEDWAETFAVWLATKKSWKKQYKRWPLALEKLTFIENTMQKLQGQKPKVQRRLRPGNISRSTRKLKTFYNDKKSQLQPEQNFDLKPIVESFFTPLAKYQKNKKASAFLKKEKPILIQTLSTWTGQSPYTLSLMIDEMIKDSEKKPFRLIDSEKNTRLHLVAMLTAFVMNSAQSGQNGIKM